MNHLAAWQLSDIEHGQWWRILSGNFTHTNFAHLAMNLAGLWVISYLFKPKARSLIVLLFLFSIWVGVGLLFTTMETYVGLSGTLHSLFAFFALQEALQGRKSSWLLVMGVIAKVLGEQWFGAPSSTAEMIHARVATEAHLAGLLGGLLLASIAEMKNRQDLKK